MSTLHSWAVVKIMTCRATDRPEFFACQRSWSALADVDGFVAQFGGWDAERSSDVLLLALWRDVAAYEAFMRETHDRIHDGSRQARTYEGLVTTLAAPVSIAPIPLSDSSDAAGPCTAGPCTAGPCTAGPYIADPGAAAHVRLADCRVRVDRLMHFLDVQRTIWNPGMIGAGAQTIWTLHERGDPNHVFIVSAWPSTDAHRRYRAEVFGALRDRAGSDEDLDSIKGWSVPLEPAWTVRTRMPT